MRIRLSAILHGSSRRKSRGQALVELALILPVLLLLVCGAIDLGRVWYSQVTITNAAREGAFEAAFNPTSYQAGQPCNATTNRVVCRAVNEAKGSAITVAATDVSMTCASMCAPGSYVAVKVLGHFSLITPLMGMFTGGQDITLSSTSNAIVNVAPGPGSSPNPTPTASPTPSPSPSPSPSPTPPGATPTPSPSPTPAPPACLAPVANFSVSPASGAKNDTVFRFTDSSTNMGNLVCNPIWSWNFGDGSGASSIPSPSYTYDKKGDYTVRLVVSNTAGTSTPRTVVIHVTN